MTRQPFAFTRANIQGLQPDLDAAGTAKRVTYRFDQVGKHAASGLVVQVTDLGAKSFYFRTRIGRGRSARKCNEFIGHWPDTTVEQARERAKELYGEIKVKGNDPVAQRRHKRAQLVAEATSKRAVSEVLDAYLEAAKRSPTRRGTVKSEKNLGIDRGRIERHIRPLLGKKLVVTLTRGDIAVFRDSVAAGETAKVVKTKKRGKAIVRGGQGTANRCLNLLGAILSFAKDHGWIAENPVSNVVKYHRPIKNRCPNDETVKAIGGILRDKMQSQPMAADQIRLLALTGARYGEIARLRHQWAELPGGLLRVPDLDNKKQRERLIVLSDAAVSILERQVRIGGSPYVFPATRGKNHYQGAPKIWAKNKKDAGIVCRIHDMRHLFSSVATKLRYPKPIVAALLGHAKTDVTDTYIAVAPQTLRDAANEIGREILRLLDGK